MNYTLHKLNTGFIVVSDEPIVKGDSFYNNIDDCIYNNANGWEILNKHTGNEDIDFKLIAQEPNIIFSDLNEDEQEKIGWFDVEKLYNKLFPKLKQNKERTLGEEVGFKIGCEVMQELLTDRMFTLENVLDAWELGAKEGLPLTKKKKENLIKLIFQKSWPVELEMNDYVEEETGSEFKWMNKRPKLTEGKIRILKVL